MFRGWRTEAALTPGYFLSRLRREICSRSCKSKVNCHHLIKQMNFFRVSANGCLTDMDPNEAPRAVLHKSRLLTTILGFGFVSSLWLAFATQIDGALKSALILVAGLFLLYVLFFEIQTIEIFPTYLSINYICRKRLIAHRDIESVSMKNFTNKGVTSKYVQLRLRNGEKITVGNLRESADVVYEKLKACESSNEEFIQE